MAKFDTVAKATRKGLQNLNQSLSAWSRTFVEFGKLHNTEYASYLHQAGINKAVVENPLLLAILCEDWKNSSGIFSLPKWIEDTKENREAFAKDILSECTITDKKTGDVREQIRVNVPLAKFSFVNFEKFAKHASGKSPEELTKARAKVEEIAKARAEKKAAEKAANAK